MTCPTERPFLHPTACCIVGWSGLAGPGEGCSGMGSGGICSGSSGLNGPLSGCGMVSGGWTGIPSGSFSGISGGSEGSSGLRAGRTATPLPILRYGFSFDFSLQRVSSVIRPAISLAQFILGCFQYLLALLRQILAGAVDIEGQHGHGRTERLCLAFVALVG